MSPRERIAAAWTLAREVARRMLGAPDYDAYLRHCRAAHPDLAPLDYAAFFAERQAARYRGTGGRCC